MQFAITSDAGAVLALLTKQTEALKNLRPVLNNVASELERVTGENLTNSRTLDGEQFAELADATLIGRLQRRKGAWRKATKGKKARIKNQREALREGNFEAWKKIRADLRSKVLAAAKAANFKPLIDTGRGRNSSRAKVVGLDTVRYSIVEYMVPHISGGKGGHPPERNFSVFIKNGDQYVLNPRFAAFVDKAFRDHVAGAR